MVASCRKFSSRTAFTMMDKELTFAELERQSAALAGFFQSRGLAKGARIALMMPNVLQYPVTIMAAQRGSKILGIFVRLDRRDGKPHYLRHLPRMRAYLRRALEHEALAELRAVYEAARLLEEPA